MTTDTHKNTRIVIAVVGLVVVGGLWGVMKSQHSGEVKRKQCVIKAIDPAARTATVEIQLDKTGELIQIPGSVPPDCKIRIDGKPATIDDVRVGDKAVFERVGRTIKSVDVTRAGPGASPQSGPATKASNT